MIKSIRKFLFINLFLSITIASSITAIGNYLLDEQIIKPYLDDELIKTLSVIEKLNQLANIDKFTRDKIKTYLKITSYPNFMFQIWDKEGKLYFHSHNSAKVNLNNLPEGFSDLIVGEKDWRTYSKIDKSNNKKIIVAEIYDTRNALADIITRNNGYILLITFPIFAILIWIIVGLALRSLTKLTKEISSRESNNLKPVATKNLPEEVTPLVIELNNLFKRLQLEFERNKRFSGDAAHELRTPLAALKTQAQVAIKSKNDIDRKKALENVIECVNRSSHVVTQLLTLSKLNQDNTNNDWHKLDLYSLTKIILTHIAPEACEKNINIELIESKVNTKIYGNDTMLGILLRNIIDNSIRYTPKNGKITTSIIKQNDEVILRVIDTGRGIPKELHDRVFERFYRVLGTKTSGSGLGLAIVSQIAKLHHARISLKTPSNNIGLQVDISFPRN
ncbi:ATP-binding protein [Gammaproteobacteria bacterium]|nr:ATP-binding protein [Gammaproteobacteria bacterium]